MLTFGDVKPGYVVQLKGSACRVTEARVIKGKSQQQPNKVFVTGTAEEGFGENAHEAGAVVKEIKPATREIQVHVMPAETSGSHADSEEEDDDSSEEFAGLEDYDFDTGDAGASLVEPMLCGDLKKGMNVVCLPNQPCRVTSISFAKGGKHGASKATIHAVNLFTGATVIQQSVPSSARLFSPVVTRDQYVVTDLQGDVPTLMNAGGDMRQDLDLPTTTTGELSLVGQQLVTTFEALQDSDERELQVVVLDCMDRQQIVEVRSVAVHD